MLTAELLKMNLSYDRATGLFTRLISSGGMVKGSIAGMQSSRNGYLQIKVLGSAYMTHRLAWFYVHGKWPEHDIDHIDGNKSNNCIENLREASRSENLQNLKSARSDSSSGVLGVRFRRNTNKWHAEIKTEGKRFDLGGFASIEAARSAYLSAKRSLHPFCTI